MKQSREEYISRYAEYAMEQMRRYGIPASITLAQGIIESADGKSTLANTANNHFGVKGTYNGNYVLATDEKPNEKFKKYDNVGQSYEDHSKVLMASRYQQYTKNLSPDDYKGWAAGIKKGGYATAGNYVSTIVGVIEGCNLQKYDQMVMEQMKKEGKTFGLHNAASQAAQGTAQSTPKPSPNYSMPVKRDEFLLVTSNYGMRMHPIDHVVKMHNGIDINTKHEALLATENGGKVIGAGFDSKGGGNFVKLEYSREDGTKTQLTYCHLSKIDVKVGDTVNAGQQIGVSGSTGKSTGDHLHFAVKQVSADGKARQIDPSAYLAEIAQKGNLPQQALLNGQDLLAKYKTQVPLDGNDNALASANTGIDTPMSADDWMKKLLSSEDSGVDLGMNGGDPIIEMVTGAFTALMAIAVQIDNKSEEEKMQMVTDAAVAKRIDLSPYMPSHKDCSISIQDSGKAVLSVDGLTHVMTQTELANLSSILKSSATDDNKMQRIAAMVDNIVFSNKAMQNYEQEAVRSQEQNNVIQR